MSTSFAFNQLPEQFLDPGFCISQGYAALLGNLIHSPIRSAGGLIFLAEKRNLCRGARSGNACE